MLRISTEDVEKVRGSIAIRQKKVSELDIYNKEDVLIIDGLLREIERQEFILEWLVKSLEVKVH